MQDSRSRIELFGGVRLACDEGVTTKFRTRKTAALLAYLALFPRHAHSREQIAEWFWPDQAPEDARNNLSTALSFLRRLLEPTGIPAGTVLQSDRVQIRLNPDAVTTDAADFERFLEAARHAQNDAAKRDALAEAMALYRGDLLAGYYEEWIFEPQNRLRERYLNALQQAVELAEKARDWDEALDFAGRLLAAEPMLETAAQAKMRALARLGRVAAAQETYAELAKRLREELGATPTDETRTLLLQLRRGTPAACAASSAEKPQISPEAAPPVPPSSAPQLASISAGIASALPLHLTRFFGRAAEMGRLCERLQVGPDAENQNASARRLVTLTGPGGAGKTRLATETAARMAEAFAGRVWFVPLEDTPDARMIPFALAHALKAPTSRTQDPFEQALAAIGPMPALLVLDNFEHLLRDAAETGKREPSAELLALQCVRALLSRLPALTLLVTSRRVLDIAGEQEFPLVPLRVPDESEPLESLQACESVAIYADRAASACPDFVLNSRNAPAVAALCRRLEGMPLAIEIAAGWVKTLPPSRMLAQLDSRLIALESRRRDLPPRQRSLRALIEWSDALLSPELRAALTQVAVFRGGWAAEAAEAVCGPQAHRLLADLQGHSLVVFDPEPGRFRLLETVREFANETSGATDAAEAARKHARYFAALAHSDPAENGGEQAKKMALLAREYDNLRAALAWTTENDLPTAMQFASDLSFFWSHQGYWQEGENWIETILTRCGGPPKVPAETATYWRLLRERAKFAGWRGDYALAETLFQSCLHWREQNDPGENAAAQRGLGFVAARRGAMREAVAYFEQAMESWRLLGRDREIRDTLLWLAYSLTEIGEEARAEAAYTEAQARARQAGDKSDLAIALNGLGEMAYRRGDYSQAEILKKESLRLCRETGLKRFKGLCLLTLADIARRRGEAAAREFFREAFLTLRELDERNALLHGIARFACWLAAQGRYEVAAQFFAAAETLRDLLGAEFTQEYANEARAALSQAREKLGAAALEQNDYAGREMPLEQAVETALAELQA